MTDDLPRRAAILGGAAVLTSGGLNPRPLNAPPAPNRGIGVQPGTQNGIIIGHTVLVFGPSGSIVGVFVYATGTTPGPGNVPLAWITNQNLDPFGNIVVPNLGAANPADNSVSTLNGDGLQTQVAGHVWAQLQAVAATAAFYLHATAFATLISDPIAAVLPGSSPAAPEVPHVATITGANFAAGSPSPRYTLMPDNTVMLDGLVSVTGVTAANATMFTLPAGYLPSRAKLFVTTNSTGTFANGSVAVQTSGAVQCAVASAGGDGVWLDGVRFLIA